MKYRASANISHLILSANCQILGLGLSALLNSFLGFDQDGFDTGIYYFCFFQGVSAFLLSFLFRLPFGWKLFNLILLPSAILYSQAALPSWILFLAFFISFLVFLPAVWTRVPYYPSSYETYEILSKILPQDKKIKFIDIGCGFATMLVYLAKKHPQIEFYGNEIGPLPYFVSKIKSFFVKNVHISLNSFWNISFTEYDYVYAFLAPPPMEKLWEKVKEEMPSGGVFISNTFEVPAKPDEIIPLTDERQNKLMIYRLNN